MDAKHRTQAGFASGSIRGRAHRNSQLAKLATISVMMVRHAWGVFKCMVVACKSGHFLLGLISRPLSLSYVVFVPQHFPGLQSTRQEHLDR